MDRIPHVKPGITLLLSILALAAGMAAPRQRDGSFRQIPLDGVWQFATDSAAAFDARNVGLHATWRKALVPSSWQLQFEELRDYQGIAWYRKSFSPGKIRSSETLLIHFGAVDYMAEVFVNGVRVGSHEGGFTPFEFDIGGVVTPGRNEILVRVMDPGGDGPIRYRQIPHGKQSWYVQTSGIWQSALVALVPKRRVTVFHATAAMNGEVVFDVWLSGRGKEGRSDELNVRILDPHQLVVAKTTVAVSGMNDSLRVDLHVTKPLLWSPTSTSLYRAELTLGENPPVIDRFGFRSFEARNGQLLLNGEPFYLIGALDQDFYPATGYTTPSEDYLRDEMTKAKRMGLNTLRCHIKIPDPRYLHVADEVGILIWCDIPNWDTYTPDAGRRGEETLDAMLARDWNHPSLVVLCLINESWGLDLKQKDQRVWLKSAFDRTKKKASGRLVVDNSACEGNFHLKTDINDYHTYWAMPENRRRFDKTVGEFAGRADWLFSPFGDAEESGEEPLVLSEFGNWGLPVIPDPEPWWMQRKFGNARVVLPAGHLERFRQFGHDRVFETEARMVVQSQAAQMSALKYEIETIRLAPQIQGYVITEFTDVHWESNGLLDMWRNPKIAAAGLAMIQQQDVIIPRPDKFNYWSADSIRIGVWFSHYSDVDLTGGSVEWSTESGEQGTLPIRTVDRGGVAPIPSVRLDPVNVSSPRKIRIMFRCLTREGKGVAENFCDVFVFPRPGEPKKNQARIYDPSGRLGLIAREFHLTTSTGLSYGDTQAPILTNQLDSPVIASLKRGETVLCLVDSETRVPPGFPLSIIKRDSGWYDGNWASSLSWVRKNSPPFSDVNFGACLGFETDVMGLPMAIGEVKPENFSSVLSGMFVGWLHQNVGYIVELNAGEGKLVLCTFPLAAHCADDPYAATVLRALVRYCEGSRNDSRIHWRL